jgi:hypothetical protein
MVRVVHGRAGRTCRGVQQLGRPVLLAAQTQRQADLTGVFHAQAEPHPKIRAEDLGAEQVHGGPLVGQNEGDRGRPAALGDRVDGLQRRAAAAGDQLGVFVNDHHQGRGGRGGSQLAPAKAAQLAHACIQDGDGGHQELPGVDGGGGHPAKAGPPGAELGAAGGDQLADHDVEQHRLARSSGPHDQGVLVGERHRDWVAGLPDPGMQRPVDRPGLRAGPGDRGGVRVAFHHPHQHLAGAAGSSSRRTEWGRTSNADSSASRWRMASAMVCPGRSSSLAVQPNGLVVRWLRVVPASPARPAPGCAAWADSVGRGGLAAQNHRANPANPATGMVYCQLTRPMVQATASVQLTMRPGQPSTGHRIAAIARARPANSTRLGSNSSANSTARTLTKAMRCQRGRVWRCQRRSWSGPDRPTAGPRTATTGRCRGRLGGRRGISRCLWAWVVLLDGQRARRPPLP